MNDQIDEARILTDVISALRPLDVDARRRLLQTVFTFFDIGRLPEHAPQTQTQTPRPANGAFSQDRSESPKQFLNEKDPESETERLVCLAYYATHYRGMPHFKTLELTQLNTEAAQIKFSNAHATMHHATTQGLIGPAPDGQRQLTARGERFVSALPDREAARALLGARRTKKKRKPSTQTPRQAS